MVPVFSTMQKVQLKSTGPTQHFSDDEDDNDNDDDDGDDK